eukprot:UN20696
MAFKRPHFCKDMHYRNILTKGRKFFFTDVENELYSKMFFNLLKIFLKALLGCPFGGTCLQPVINTIHNFKLTRRGVFLTSYTIGKRVVLKTRILLLGAFET